MYDSILIAQSSGGGSVLSMLTFPLLLIAVMYFLLFRPQQKQMQQAQQFRDSLKVGDRVITAGGIFGTITEIETDRVSLEIASKVKIRVLRTQVVSRQPGAAKADGSTSDGSKASAPASEG